MNIKIADFFINFNFHHFTSSASYYYHTVWRFLIKKPCNLWSGTESVKTSIMRLLLELSHLKEHEL